MRKITLTLILTLVMILMAISANAQLEQVAQAVKNTSPQKYGLIKAYAEQQFESDYTMVVYSINKQAKNSY